MRQKTGGMPEDLHGREPEQKKAVQLHQPELYRFLSTVKYSAQDHIPAAAMQLMIRVRITNAAPTHLVALASLASTDLAWDLAM